MILPNNHDLGILRWRKQACQLLCNARGDPADKINSIHLISPINPWVQWKMAAFERLGKTHFSLNHDYGRQEKYPLNENHSLQQIFFWGRHLLHWVAGRFKTSTVPWIAATDIKHTQGLPKNGMKTGMVIRWCGMDPVKKKHLCICTSIPCSFASPQWDHGPKKAFGCTEPVVLT